MPRQRAILIAVAAALVVLAGALIYGMMNRTAATPAPGIGTFPGQQQNMTLRVADRSTLPADVRDAAARLYSSRVGYAMQRGDQTYLIISTGSDQVKIRADHAEVQSAGGLPSFIDVNLRSAAAGDRQLILSAPVRNRTEFQFNLDGVMGSIPALVNRENLPLIALPSDQRFALVSPVEAQMIEGEVLMVEGYARVFEARFTMRLMSEKGRTIAETYPMAAAGAPNWGSFRAQMNLYGLDLPATAFLVLEEEMTGARMVVPVRFRMTPQMG